jgi:integrase
MRLNVLTDTKCRGAKCRADIAVTKLADGGGLYLWIFANGRKYWRLRYKVDGKEKLLALGVYPSISLSDARAKRDDAQKQRAHGVDPVAARRVVKRETLAATENNFERVAWEWFERKKIIWVESHTRDMRSRLVNDLLPVLSARRIDKITPTEVRAVIAQMEERGANDLARRVLQMASQVFRFGMATEKCQFDPTVGLNKIITPHITKNQPAVRPEELPALLAAIAKYEAIGDRQTRIGLQLLAHTFVRTAELLGATWAEFDTDAALWTIPAERMKMRREHHVPLARQALALLEELRPITGHAKFLLPGRNPAKPISNNTLLFALYRLGYKDRMTGHGFRAVASTVLNEQGFRPDVIEAQLAHAEANKVRAAYNRAQYMPERRAMMQHWADYLESLTTNTRPSAPRN